MYRDRLEAGSTLAAALGKYKNDPGIILAVPRGGIPVAYAVAKELGFPLEIILTKKIGHPMNKEYAIGAASLSDYFIVTHEGVSEEYIEKEVRSVQAKLKTMYHHYMGERKPIVLEGKTVIVIDDGIATGNTLLATVNILRKGNPGKLVIAAPVASASAMEKLAVYADDIVVPLVPDAFYGVGAFYEDFDQVSDEDALFYLDKLREWRKAG